MQAHLAHDPVEDEGGARHVATVLQQADEEEQHQDLREKDDHAPDPADDTVDQQAFQLPLRHDIGDEIPERPDAGVDHVHERHRELEDAVEEQAHHPAKRAQAPDRMQQHMIETVGPAPPVGIEAVQALPQDLADERVALRDDFTAPAGDLAVEALAPEFQARDRRPQGELLEAVFIRRERETRLGQRELRGHARPLERGGQFAGGFLDQFRHLHDRPRLRQVGASELQAQIDDPLVPMGLDRHHRHAEFPCHAFGVDPHPATARDVDHVQADHGREAQLDDLRDQVEVALEIARIDQTKDDVRRTLPGNAAEKKINQDPLVRRTRMQAVGSRQVDDPERLAMLGKGRPLLPLDGHPGVVPDLLAQSGQGVEDGRLATVGIAQQGHRRNLRRALPRSCARSLRSHPLRR